MRGGIAFIALCVSASLAFDLMFAGEMFESLVVFLLALIYWELVGDD
jgi:hypothetical protein